MKIFVDTNIILDVLLKRDDLYESSARILSLHNYEHTLGVNVITFSNTFYLIAKYRGSTEALRNIRYLADIVVYEEIPYDVFNAALHSQYKYIEDALQYYTARAMSYDVLCTRNVKDFRKPDIPVLTPEEVLLRVEE